MTLTFDFFDFENIIKTYTWGFVFPNHPCEEIGIRHVLLIQTFKKLWVHEMIIWSRNYSLIYAGALNISRL